MKPDPIMALGVVLVIMGAVLLGIFILSLVDARRADAFQIHAQKGVRPAKPPSHCPLCLFEARPLDRWTPYLLIGEAIPCEAHRAEFARMMGAWDPSAGLDISERDTAEIEVA